MLEALWDALPVCKALYKKMCLFKQFLRDNTHHISKYRPDTSRRQQKQLPPCSLVIAGLHALFLKGQGHQGIFSLVKGTLWGNCQFLLEPFKGTKAMTRGHGAGLSLPICPWNASVEIYNFLMVALYQGENALVPFQKQSIQTCEWWWRNPKRSRYRGDLLAESSLAKVKVKKPLPPLMSFCRVWIPGSLVVGVLLTPSWRGRHPVTRLNRRSMNDRGEEARRTRRWWKKSKCACRGHSVQSFYLNMS